MSAASNSARPILTATLSFPLLLALSSSWNSTCKGNISLSPATLVHVRLFRARSSLVHPRIGVSISFYTVTSTFTLAKCVRDRQEETAAVSRIDQVRLDQLLAEQDVRRVTVP